MEEMSGRLEVDITSACKSGAEYCTNVITHSWDIQAPLSSWPHFNRGGRSLLEKTVWLSNREVNSCCHKTGSRRLQETTKEVQKRTDKPGSSVVSFFGYLWQRHRIHICGDGDERAVFQVWSAMLEKG